MTLNAYQAIITIAAIAITTFFIRAVPFILFPEDKSTPEYIEYIGIALPCAIMAMLIVYCLKSVSVLSFPFGLPEVIAIVVIAAVHFWKKNMLLSIATGTILYMFLVQIIFK